MRFAACPLLLLAATPCSGREGPAATTQALDTPGYAIELDVEDLPRATFTMRVPMDALVLRAPADAAVEWQAHPACDGRPLPPVEGKGWLKPAGCSRVAWAVRVRPLDGRAFDATRPTSFWSGRHRLWSLSGDLPWLRYPAQPDTPVRIVARLGSGKTVIRHSRLPQATDVPVSIAIGEVVRRSVSGPVEMVSYGAIPEGPRYEALRQQLVTVLARWREEILPEHINRRSRLSYIWVDRVADAEPGLFASTGSDAILMQFIPDRQSPHPFEKLEAGTFLTGAHEGFHALSGALSSGKPEWVNESWAAYFAYRAARETLNGRPLRLAEELFAEPASVSVLSAQAKLDRGDGSAYQVFYTRAARFWAAIDRALLSQSNGSGKLAALIKQSRGMDGVNWRDPDSIARFLDPLTGGRATSIVRCYLVDDGCLNGEAER